MGQKSNTITLRKGQKSLSLFGNGTDNRGFLFGLQFLTSLEQLFSQKNVLVVNKTLNFINNQCFLTVILKLHPHIKEIPNGSLNEFDILASPNIPAEILISHVAKNFNIVNVFHHGSSVTRYVSFKNVFFHNL